MPTPEIPNPTEKDGIYRKILSRYSTIWIWSILVALNSTLTFSFYNYRQTDWRILGLLLAATYMGSFAMCILAWQQLLRFLRGEIIPSLARPEESEQSVLFGRDKEKRLHLLSNTLSFLVYAITFKFAAFILEILFGALTKIGS